MKHNAQTLVTQAAINPVLIAEYRSGGTESEIIRWRDKSTGAAQTAEVRNYNFEAGPMLVRLQLPREVKPDATLGLASPLDLQRGQLYVIHVASAAMNRGVLAVTGTIHGYKSPEGPATR